MTKASGNDPEIDVPERNGIYKLYVADGQGNTSSGSDAVLRVSGSLLQTEAENYSSQSGIETETCSEGGENIGYIENGDYAVYNGIKFDSGSVIFQVRAACGGSGGEIEIRIDGEDGPLIGTCTITGTGGWQTWEDFSCNINETEGEHDVYLSFTGGDGYLYNLNWFEFRSDVTQLQQTVKNNKIGRFKIEILRDNIFVGLPGNKAEYSVSVFMLNGKLIERKKNCVKSLKIPLKARGVYIVLINQGRLVRKKVISYL